MKSRVQPAPSSSESIPERPQRRPRRTRRKDRSDAAATPSDQGSVLWTVLLVGLIFCLLDVAYLLGSLERQEHTSNANPSKQQQPLLQPPQNKQEDGVVVTVQHAADKNEDAPLSKEERERLVVEKQRILSILEEAGIFDVDDDTLQDLPTWEQVVQLYGEKPRIYGLEQCEPFRKHSDEADHFVSTAGTFNTGTNLMAELLINNCHMQKRMNKYGVEQRGIRWQVPWGKHTPPGDEEFRLTHKTTKDKDVDATEILPAVTIRDPYVWMQSMCRHKYTARWLTDPTHCPNLVPTKEDLELFPELAGKDTVEVSVKYNGFFKYHDSLAHFWNDWYNEYVNVEFPRLIVRFEDILFHAKEVTETVCHCAGGEMNRHKFTYIVDSAKRGKGAHGKVRTGYVDALIKYGTDRHRYDGYGPQDLAFMKEHLDANLTEFFGYRHAPQELLP